MNINSEATDLSLVKNQNELALRLVSFFTVEELLLIDTDSIILKNNSKMELIYQRKFDYNSLSKNISILSVELDNSALKVSCNKFIFIRVETNNCSIDFKYRFNKSIIKFIALSIKKAINYINFKNPTDGIIIKKNIINNAANKLAKKYNLEVLEEINYIVFDITSRDDVLNEGFEYSNSIDYRTTVAIETMKYYIAFGIYDSINKNNPFIFLVDKRMVGLSQLSMISEESIAFKNKASH